jgi:hypothetical protein
MTIMRVCVALLVLTVAGCAENRPVIDQVQPNATRKKDLLGREWYVRTTVVHGNFTNAESFPGAMGSLERGVFDIQERALYFYRTYEFVQGSEAYTQKSDVDVPMRDEAGKPITHAVPQAYQKVACQADGDCLKGSRCADPKRKDAWPDEDHWAGYCVTEATRYIYRGAPVMAFPITSHFDIRFDYSPASGEKTNVRLENTFDRKWYDRDYIRVAWGAHQLMDYAANPLPTGGQVIYGGDTAPEGEQFEEGEDLRLGAKQRWFTYIAREVHAAPTTYLPGFGQVPKCLFYPWYIGGVYDCASEEYKVRTFFLEVPQYPDPNTRYVARDMDDVEMEKFGYFRSERESFDPHFGKTFHGAVRRAQRHRIWDRYVKKLDADGGWRGEFDYSQMQPAPIVYYLNDDHPRELVAASVEIGKSWSPAFQDVVKFHKPELKDVPPMFIVCENSNASAAAARDAGADYAKGEVGEHGAIGKYAATPWAKYCEQMDQPHRFGDLRWNMMHAVPAPAQNGLYGYGPSAADPLTGEVISASAHSYAAVMKLGAESALQALELQAGVIDFNDVKRASQKTYGVGIKRAKTYDQKGPKSLDEVRGVVAGAIDADVALSLQSQGMAPDPAGGTWAQAQLARLKSAKTVDALLATDDDGRSVSALFREWGTKSSAPQQLSPDQLQRFSLANWAHVAGVQKRQKVFDELAAKTLHFADFTDGAIVGLAQEYGREYDKRLCTAFAAAKGTLFSFEPSADDPTGSCTPGEFQSLGIGKGQICVASGGKAHWSSCATTSLMQAMREKLNEVNGGNPNADLLNYLPGPLYTDTMDPTMRATQEVGKAVVDQLRAEIKRELWAHIYRDTQLHEVGHTLGLRHNFEASTDALNFHQKFWDLKLDDKGEVVNPLQPDTPEQGAGHLREQQLASVMDYTAKFNGRFAGVGHYDHAAIRFAYGDLVEAYKTPPVLDKPVGALPAATAYLATPQDAEPGLTPLLQDGNPVMTVLNRRIHYSAWPKYFGKDKKEAVARMYDRALVPWSKVRGRECMEAKDCAASETCQPLGDASYCAAKELSPGVPLVEVPYRFCSDEYNGRTPTCATWDEGVDAYEIARNALDDYENYWYFWGYSRDSETFMPDNYYGRVSRQFAVATRQFQSWAIQMATFNRNGWWQKQFGKDYNDDVNGGLAGAYGAINTFNTLASVLSRPVVGYFAFNPKTNVLQPPNQVDQNSQDTHWIDELDGARPLYPSYGGGYMYRPMSAGQIYDRLAAFLFLSDPTTLMYPGLNKQEDTRRYLVNFYRVWPRQMMNLFAGIQVDDAKHFGWYVLQGPPTKADVLLRRTWVGKDAGKTPPACDPAVDNAQQVGCLKYVMYPDDRPAFPSSRFRMPLLAGLYGMSFLSKTYDRSYLDISRIFLAGNHHQIEFAPSVAKDDIATFTDPLSGKTYVAAKMAGDVLNPAWTAVKQAQAELDKFPDLTSLQNNYLLSDYQYRVSLLELARSLHEAYEY